jgi:ribonuclease G
LIDIVVNATARETRIALLEQRTVTELFIEQHTNCGLVGHIYRGRVAKILPGMQAAFVDIGLPKAGFLHVSDILVDPHTPPWGSETTQRALGPSSDVCAPQPSGPPEPAYAIAELLDAGQEILVQVAKEPLGTKGCRLTTYLTLAGRYLVLMPGVEHIGVSRRIPDEAEKERLRAGVKALLPEGMGCIVRTLSVGVSPQELQADLRFLMALWQHVQHQAREVGAPCLVHHEVDLVLRTLRDCLTVEVERVIIDDAQAYARAQAFLQAAELSHLATNLVLYEDTTPLFEAFGIEREIERALQHKVWLKSGGSIVIDHTEALVAIDVNTGRFVGKSDPAATMLTTNLEAVQEIIRQLRLRNLGGLVVIDFIDMDMDEHRQLVFQALEEALRYDRARTKILQMSEFGLVEMTRKRVRASLDQVLCEPCSYCRGTGRMESATTVCSKVLREIQRVMRVTPYTKKVMVNVRPTVAAMLYNEERVHVAALEQTWHITLAIQGDNDMPHGHFEVLSL